MTMEIIIQNKAEIQKYLDTLPENTFGQAKKAFQVTALAIQTKVKKNAKNILHVRTGGLKNSISTNVSGLNLKDLKGSIFSGYKPGGSEIVYAPIHEYGGIINAKNAYKGVPGGPYLNIPTDENKTPAGITRMTARMVFNAGGYIAGKGVYLNDVRMFSLVKSVTIPARLGMMKSTDDEIPTLLSTLANVIGE